MGFLIIIIILLKTVVGDSVGTMGLILIAGKALSAGTQLVLAAITIMVIVIPRVILPQMVLCTASIAARVDVAIEANIVAAKVLRANKQTIITGITFTVSRPVQAGINKLLLNAFNFLFYQFGYA